ncbi:MAG: hypothetical protein ACRERD_10440 [Candidatus Binatia bacterium]
MGDPKTSLRYVIADRRRATDYEELTLHSQWSPYNFAKQGWFNLTNDGRAPWDDNSTRLRCVTVSKPESWWYSSSKVKDKPVVDRRLDNGVEEAAVESQSGWYAYRDPGKQWFRPYVEQQATQESMIEEATKGALRLGLYRNVSGTWLSFLSRYFAAYRYPEYGIFMALSYAQREALSDVVAGPILFQAVDKERHAQAIALHCMELEKAVEGFSDAAAKDVWMDDPVYQPVRRYVEQLLACRDWAEILFAVNLSFEPLVGRLFTNYLIARQGCACGDPVTPIIAETAEADRQRSLASAAELARFVIANVPDNKGVIEGWLAYWLPQARAAAAGLSVLAQHPQEGSADFQATLETITTEHGRLLSELGLHVSEASL